MHKSRLGFTLVELLTVAAIVMVLAAVTYPVFRSSIESAHKTVCVSNFRQAYMATFLYMEDYSETFMPVNYQPAGEANSKNDRTWVQMVLPYASSYTIFKCPGDKSTHPRSDTVFDQDLVPGDIYSRYYTDSMRTNLGYNYLYVSPVVHEDTGWTSQPKQVSMIENPGDMLLYVDSVWDRDTNGQPIGGGSWLVIPPCRYAQQGQRLIDTFGLVGKDVFARNTGWVIDNSNSGLRYGGAWAWHTRHLTTVRTDGSAASLSMDELTTGCVVKDNWTGLVDGTNKYIWDPR